MRPEPDPNGLEGHLQVAEGPELYLGIVSPTGTDLDAVCTALSTALRRVNYDSEVIRLSPLLGEVRNAPWDLAQEPEDERIRTHQDAGDRLCSDMKRLDAVALLGILRMTKRTARPSPRKAFIIRSLKRPEEVETLRKIYGPWFYVVAAYSPRELHKARLEGRIRDEHLLMTPSEVEAAADQLLRRDEGREKSSSQNLADTFHQADVFVDARTDARLTDSTQRFVDLLFGTRLITPSRDEYGMFHALCSAMRSSSLSRQVGTAISNEDGEVVAMGTNEVPLAGGGFYWDDDDEDDRDHRDYKTLDRREPSLVRRRKLLAEVLDRLRPWMTLERQTLIQNQVNRAVDDAWSSLMQGSQLTSLIEFQRTVHAEMAAVTDACRRGVSVEDATLYSTTYPCHLCAKHIVAAGIKRVVYVEPYPKSRAIEFYPDSIVHDPLEKKPGRVPFEAFVGVAPLRYLELFQAEEGERAVDGVIVEFEQRRDTAQPRVGQPRQPEPLYLAVLANELTFAQLIVDRLEEIYGSQEEA